MRSVPSRCLTVALAALALPALAQVAAPRTLTARKLFFSALYEIEMEASR